ncbi:type IV pilus modification PilV family protein [Aureibaculum luteum]|uniref:type IV pilus modification PilV family protein n=1 Tax=Aureibaculum luteum TaxID=1548456 RepID=UPI000E4B836F|nr:hypothetical protein [Aureibaculum luteum]
MLKRRIHKKLKASTLVEVLVASVIIILIFAIASMTLNNVFQSSIQGNTHRIDTHLNKLKYLYEHDKISNDYQDSFKDYDITFSKLVENDQAYVLIEAVQKTESESDDFKKKIIIKKVLDATSE